MEAVERKGFSAGTLISLTDTPMTGRLPSLSFPQLVTGGQKGDNRVLEGLNLAVVPE
jgi:hypothetical protein